jgi:hypothetical protein
VDLDLSHYTTRSIHRVFASKAVIVVVLHPVRTYFLCSQALVSWYLDLTEGALWTMDVFPHHFCSDMGNLVRARHFEMNKHTRCDRSSRILQRKKILPPRTVLFIKCGRASGILHADQSMNMNWGSYIRDHKLRLDDQTYICKKSSCTGQDVSCASVSSLEAIQIHHKSFSFAMLR